MDSSKDIKNEKIEKKNKQGTKKTGSRSSNQKNNSTKTKSPSKKASNKPTAKKTTSKKKTNNSSKKTTNNRSNLDNNAKTKKVATKKNESLKTTTKTKKEKVAGEKSKAVDTEKEVLENISNQKVQDIKQETKKEEKVENDDFDGGLTLKNLEEIEIEQEKAEIKRRKHYKVIEPLIVIVLLIICFVALYKLVLVSKKAIVTSWINSISSEINNSIDWINKYKLSDNMLIKTNIEFSSTNENLLDFTKYNYGLNIGIDHDKETIDGKFRIDSLDNNNLIDLDYMIMQNKSYLKENNIYYYPLMFEKKISNWNLKKWDLNGLKEINSDIKRVIFDNIDLEMITKKNETIQVNAKDIKVKVYELNYSKEAYQSLKESVGKAIINDEELLKKIERFTNVEEELLTELNKLIEMESQEVQIKLYTKGIWEDAIGFEIIMDGKKVISSFDYEGYKEFRTIRDNCELVITYNNEILLMSYSDVRILTLKFVEKGIDKVVIDYDLNMITDKYKGTIEVLDLKDNKYNLKVSFINSSDSKINGEINCLLEVSKDYTVQLDRFNDAVNVKDLTLEDIDGIKTKIEDVFLKLVLE